MLAEALAERRVPEPTPYPLGENLNGALRLPSSPRAQTVPRLFAPPLPEELRTETARKHTRPPPMWMVAAGSGLAALFAAGLVIAVASWTARRGADVAPTSTAIAAPTALATAEAARVIPVAATGPFGSARNAFAVAIAVPPPSAAPTVVPASTANAAPTAAAPAPPPAATAPTTPAPAAAADTVAVAPPPPTLATASPPPTASPHAAAPLPVANAGVPHPAHRPQTATPGAPAASGSDHGQLSIICFPACDAVFDNGQAIGPSPIFKRTVSVGEHRLRMTSSNPSATKVVSVIVMGDQTTTVRQPMTP
jgi:hypothetical protein